MDDTGNRRSAGRHPDERDSNRTGPDHGGRDQSRPRAGAATRSPGDEGFEHVRTAINRTYR